MERATMHQLKIFVTVARHLSFSRAAEALHLTQPAVSIQVKQLEDHVGSPLLEQLGRRIHLTAAGEAMLSHCEAILTQFREAAEAMAQFQGVAGGTLNVAVISAGDYFVPQLLAEFGRRHDGVVLNLAVSNRTEVMRLLAENRTDLAIMVRPPGTPDTLATSFAAAPYVVVAAPDHPLAGRRRLKVRDLLAHTFVARERASDTRNAMEAAFGERVHDLRVLMEISSNETLKQAVIAGLGIAFMSAHAITSELRLGKLAVLDVQGLPFERRWHLVQRKGKRLPPVAVAFKEFLVRDGAGLIDALGGSDKRLAAHAIAPPRSTRAPSRGRRRPAPR